LDIKHPEGLELAANHRYSQMHELEGDIEALRLIDLDREGLGEYKPYLEQYFKATESSTHSTTSSDIFTSSLESAIENIFRSIDVTNSGTISSIDSYLII
jgi:hypothetical protein